ncbi:MAG TPA: hypothetical protein VFW66_13345 [Gemmatimonadales bacterium]|nr:hypothetical protein [Gemmatimonadales bacterium]
MADAVTPALTPEQWDARDYRQQARVVDAWARGRADGARQDDTTEYVAKLGISDTECVIVMSRAHDRVLVPPPARPVLAAFALAAQPFGFTQADVTAVRRAAELGSDGELSAALRGLSERLAALVPPARG